MNIDVDNKVQYCGCGFTAAGQMVILFQDGQLSTNIDQCFNKQCLDKALDDVPSESLLTYETRTDIKKYYTDKIDSVKAEINQTLNKEYTFDVDFDAAAAKLNGTNADWKGNLGSFVFLYFQALSNTLKSQNFDSDDMLQEGLNEAAESGKMSFRIVDSLSSGYGEVVFEDGILYLQVCCGNCKFVVYIGLPSLNRPLPTSTDATLTTSPTRLSTSCNFHVTENYTQNIMTIYFEY